jgi:hypothetical protein
MRSARTQHVLKDGVWHDEILELSFKGIVLQNNKFVSEVIVPLKTQPITKLRIVDGNLREEEILQLAAVAREHPTLRRLELFANDYTQVGIDALNAVCKENARLSLYTRDRMESYRQQFAVELDAHLAELKKEVLTGRKTFGLFDSRTESKANRDDASLEAKNNKRPPPLDLTRVSTDHGSDGESGVLVSPSEADDSPVIVQAPLSLR